MPNTNLKLQRLIISLFKPAIASYISNHNELIFLSLSNHELTY
ncbi:hypothetical protein [Okeania sp. KiyG1]|nr:hypothetical protein [Okeania sp. KiyG1]